MTSVHTKIAILSRAFPRLITFYLARFIELLKNWRRKNRQSSLTPCLNILSVNHRIFIVQEHSTISTRYTTKNQQKKLSLLSIPLWYKNMYILIYTDACVFMYNAMNTWAALFLSIYENTYLKHTKKILIIQKENQKQFWNKKNHLIFPYIYRKIKKNICVIY